MLIIREMQIKMTMRYHLTPVRMASIKKSTNKSISAGEGVEKRETLALLVGLQTDTVTMENSMEIP